MFGFITLFPKNIKTLIAFVLKMGEKKEISNLSLKSKIVFLGTGAGKFARGKQLRATGGFVIQVAGNQFHIDPGPGALIRANQHRINPRENTAIIISHAHIGHCNDVNAVIDAMTYSGFDKQGVLVANQTVINGTEEIRPYLTEYHKNCVEKMMVIKEGQKVGINEIEILALKAKHNEPNALGFKFFTPEFVLTYTGDTEYSNELIEQYKNTDILILNVKYHSDKKEKYNLCSADAINLIKKTSPKLAIITHFGAKMLEADPIYEAREIQKETACQVIAAKDGTVISPSSYSALMKQKTLKSF